METMFGLARKHGFVSATHVESHVFIDDPTLPPSVPPVDPLYFSSRFETEVEPPPMSDETYVAYKTLFMMLEDDVTECCDQLKGDRANAFMDQLLFVFCESSYVPDRFRVEFNR
jgi:hypothetical protein